MCMWSLLTFWPQCIFVFIVGYFDLRVDSTRAIRMQHWKFFESMLWELGMFFVSLVCSIFWSKGKTVHRVIAAYNLVVGIVFFGALRLAGRLRKDKVKSNSWPGSLQSVDIQATEKMGSDWVNHGEESYPEAAWLQLEVFLSFFLSYEQACTWKNLAATIQVCALLHELKIGIA